MYNRIQNSRLTWRGNTSSPDVLAGSRHHAPHSGRPKFRGSFRRPNWCVMPILDGGRLPMYDSEEQSRIWNDPSRYVYKDFSTSHLNNLVSEDCCCFCGFSTHFNIQQAATTTSQISNPRPLRKQGICLHRNLLLSPNGVRNRALINQLSLLPQPLRQTGHVDLVETSEV